MTSTKILFAAAFVAALAGADAARAVDEYNVSTGTTVDGQGVALRGTDPVALAEGPEVAPGHARFTAVHDGVAYYFASAETMARFAADPERYMPRYGGFCAFGVAKGKKLDGDPRYADVVDGKLYLFLNAAVFEAYSQDKAGVLAAAERNWPGMHHRSVAEVNGLETASLR
jgi:YHS domain-containing protein